MNNYVNLLLTRFSRLFNHKSSIFISFALGLSAHPLPNPQVPSPIFPIPPIQFSFQPLTARLGSRLPNLPNLPHLITILWVSSFMVEHVQFYYFISNNTFHRPHCTMIFLLLCVLSLLLPVHPATMPYVSVRVTKRFVNPPPGWSYTVYLKTALPSHHLHLHPLPALSLRETGTGYGDTRVCIYYMWW